jgi:hypothetical protein
MSPNVRLSASFCPPVFPLQGAGAIGAILQEMTDDGAGPVLFGAALVDFCFLPSLRFTMHRSFPQS